jgi:arylsulfatase A-like enzyme
MTRTFLTYFGAGLILALLELCLTFARGYGLFLTTRERAEFAWAALSALPVCVLLPGLLIARASASRADAATRAARWRLLLAVVVCGLAAWVGHLLSAGRRVRDLPYRHLAVSVLALAAGAGFMLLLRLAARVSKGSERMKQLFFAGALVAAGLCLGADAWILPRGYPAFHMALFVLSLLFAASSVAPIAPDALFAHPLLARREARLARVALAWCALAPLALFHLARQPNASYATSERAPFTAKLLLPFLRSQAPAGEAAVPQLATLEQVSGGVDLRDRDVLLITVDALRADLLRAHGGSGLTPAIDALATESLVFRHAYTAAPHTSYALASLLTAKFIKPVTELASAPQDHKTLPDLLRRYGYRTAAFYPPAVFYVDGARFSALAERSFGFEYKKEMFASAEQRVQQLADYLAQAEPRPLFIWLHLFEPHEPYDPPSELATADSARGRYEGEVRAADRAIGELVRVFRGARPRGTVIVSADHGEEFGDHGGSYHGTTLFDEQVHVPLLWSSPGAVKPGVSDVPVELVDVGSTILSTAFVPRDPRMRGDDLSGVLAGSTHGPQYAFASVEERHMVMDGRYKAICSASHAFCQLFDLAHDAKEQRNLAGEEGARVAALRGVLSRFLSSIAEREVMAVEQGVSFPEPLVRARLGAPGSGADVIPLLADARASVRAASARILGELAIASAQPRLVALAASDGDADVRAEAAIAALTLDAASPQAAVVALLDREDASAEGLSRKRRAALALAARKDLRAVPWLSDWARDGSAQESERLHVLVALGKLADASAVPALIAVLSEVRLRDAAAEALAEIGGAEAREALFAALSAERYEPARRAEALALIKLGDARVAAQIERFLGMETSIPSGVRMLVELGALGRRGALASNAAARRGAFTCGERGCVPGKGARILLPVGAGARAQRVSLLVASGAANSTLRVGELSFRCAEGEQQLSFTRPSHVSELPVASDGPVTLIAWVSVPETPEIPPPAPEPWDGGAAEDASP